MHMKRVGVAVDCHLQPSAQHDTHWAFLRSGLSSSKMEALSETFLVAKSKYPLKQFYEAL